MKKLGILMLLTFGLFSCGQQKEDTVSKTSGKTDSNVVSENKEVDKKEEQENFKTVKETVLKSNTYSLINDIYSENGKNIGEKIKALTEIFEETEDLKALSQLSYLNSFYGNYTEHKKQIERLCAENPKLPLCIKDNFEVTVSIPTDENGRFLNDLKFSFNGEEEIQQQGRMKFEGYGNTYYRFKISKKGYTDFFDSYSSVKDTGNSTERKTVSINPKLIKAEVKKRTFINKPIEVETSNFTYEVKANSFTKKDGTKISGPIDIFFFNITPNEQDNGAARSVLNQSVFDENGNLVGNGMVTHGMPLVKAYKGDEELKITTPIIGTGKIMAKNKAVGMNLEDVPKNEWLNKEELDKYKIPPFWNLSKEGVWHESELMILNKNGDYKFKLGL